MGDGTMALSIGRMTSASARKVGRVDETIRLCFPQPSQDTSEVLSLLEVNPNPFEAADNLSSIKRPSFPAFFF